MVVTLEDIIGDSKGKEAALKIAEWMDKNHHYDYYYPDHNPEIKRNPWNCYDGLIPHDVEIEREKQLKKIFAEVKNDSGRNNK